MYTIHRATGEVGWWGLFGQVIAVCCSVLQCVAVRCSVLQCVAVCERATGEVGRRGPFGQDVAVCCSVLQCVAVCCSVWACYRWSSSTRPIWTRCCMRFSSFGLPLLPKFEVTWYTTGTHSQKSECYEYYYAKWLSSSLSRIFALFELGVALVAEIRSHLIHHWYTFSNVSSLPTLLSNMTIGLFFWNLCAYCRSTMSFDAPLEHILKRQLTTNTTL